MSRKFKFHSNLTRITGAVHKDVFTFTTFRLIFLRMTNVSDESCTESQNTYFTFSYFSENRAVYEIMCKNMVQPDRPQMTI
jgi:hypothetical protein